MEEITIEELSAAIEEVKPLITGEAGNYQGMYESACKKLCNLFGWEHENA